MKKSVKLLVLVLVLALLAGGYFLLKSLDLEQKQADLETEMCDPAIANNVAKLQEISKKQNALL